MSISNNVDPNAQPARPAGGYMQPPAQPSADAQHQASVRKLLTAIAVFTGIVAVGVVVNAIGSFVLVGMLTY